MKSLMLRSSTYHPNRRPLFSRSCPHERRNMRSVWPGSFGGYRGILEHGYYGGREVFLRVASGKYQVGIYQSKTNSMAEAAVDPADIGTWVHLVGTYDGSSWNLYKNGELIASSPSTVGVLPVNCDWLIGGSQATNRCFKGEIRDAGIWNVAMTPDEVSTHYTQGFSQSVTSSATYDAVGNILTQTDAMGNTTSYTYDSMGRVVTMTDALNNVTSYTYDALGRLLTTTDDVLWSLTDHLGTVRDILGTASTHLIYDAFGNLISGTNPLLFGFTGKAFDTNTNLQNNINRWYDAAIGRWLSTDPIGFNGNDTNLYRYVSNYPINAFDFNGLALKLGIIQQQKWQIEDEYGNIYNGNNSKELLTVVRKLSKNCTTIRRLIVKGHGDCGGVYDAGGKAFLYIEENRIVIHNRSVTNIIKNIVDENTHISLRGCHTHDAARNLDKLIPEARISGTLTPVVGIPETMIIIGPWWTY